MIALEVTVITLSAFFGSEVISCRWTVTDLDTSVANIVRIARVTAPACSRCHGLVVVVIIIIVVVDDDGLANDFFQAFVINAILSTPLHQLLKTDWLNLFSSVLPIAEGVEQRVIVGVDVPDSRYRGKLHTSSERNTSSTADSIGTLLPGTGNDLVKILLGNFREQLFDRSTDLLRGLLVIFGQIVLHAVLGKDLSSFAILLLLLKVGSFNEPMMVRDILQCGAGFVHYFRAEVISNAVNVMRYFCRVQSVVIHWLGL